MFQTLLKKTILRSLFPFTLVLGSVLVTSTDAAIAALFEQVDVDQDKFIAVAVYFPKADRYNLLILEQQSDSQLCWQEKDEAPGQIDPLLLGFDFSGICGRSTDSNGYSIRQVGEDLALKYRLSIVRRGKGLALVGIPNTPSNGPHLEIGRTQSRAGDFLEIELNQDWRFTRRAYQGKELGHIYLTRDVLPPEALVSEGESSEHNSEGDTGDNTTGIGNEIQGLEGESVESIEPGIEASERPSRSNGDTGPGKNAPLPTVPGAPNLAEDQSGSEDFLKGNLFDEEDAIAAPPTPSRPLGTARPNRDRRPVSPPATTNPNTVPPLTSPVQIPVPFPAPSRAQTPASTTPRRQTPAPQPFNPPSPSHQRPELPRILPSQPEARRPARPKPTQANAEVAVVPVTTIAPLGRIGKNEPDVFSDGDLARLPRNIGGGSLDNPPPPPVASALAFRRYRVVVNPRHRLSRQDIAPLVPDAFWTTYKGRRALQLGAFERREKADELLEVLNRRGIEGIMESVQY